MALSYELINCPSIQIKFELIEYEAVSPIKSQHKLIKQTQANFNSTIDRLIDSTIER